MDARNQIPQAPLTNMQQLVSHWACIMQPVQQNSNKRKKRSRDDSDIQPSKKMTQNPLPNLAKN